MSILPTTCTGADSMKAVTDLAVKSKNMQSGLVSQASNFTGSKSEIRAQIEALLSNIPKGDDGKLSFNDIDEHRKTLETKWDETVKADLEKLGVNVDKEFPLSWNAATGKLTVNDSHPDKATIDKYFESNSDRVDEFKRIIQLGKMTATHKQKADPVQLMRNIQSESMAWWYEDNSDPTSWFKGGGRFMGGGSQAGYQGLNLKV